MGTTRDLHWNRWFDWFLSAPSENVGLGALLSSNVDEA